MVFNLPESFVNCFIFCVKEEKELGRGRLSNFSFSLQDLLDNYC